MYLGFALNSSDIDLWNIDLLDTDLLDTSKHFVYFQDVLKTSSRYVFKTSWGRLQHNKFSSSKTSSRRLVRCLQDVLEDEKLVHWRRTEDVFKTSWRLTIVCWIMCSWLNLQRNIGTLSRDVWQEYR